MTDPLPPHPKKDDPDFAEKKREYNRAYNARPENKERIKEQQRAYNAKNKERIKEQKHAYNARPENKEWRKKLSRANKLKRKYGLTPQDEDAMVAAQNGLCATCGKPPRGKINNTRLVVDHCHKPAKVRGMLCSKCNSGLGFADDSPTLLRKMATYIESYQ